MWRLHKFLFVALFWNIALLLVLLVKTANRQYLEIKKKGWTQGRTPGRRDETERPAIRKDRIHGGATGGAYCY